jgi:dipeptidyl aminopeptidase/acylaminoacyl peptidase
MAMLFSGVSSNGQSPRPLTLISLAEIPRIQDVQLSPDGRFVSYMLARADWKANRLVAHIWRQATDGGTPLQITNGDAGDATARWSPDGRTLAYMTRGDSGLQLFLVSADGGQPRQLTHHVTGVYGGVAPAWAPDGSALYFLAADARPDLERERERLRDDIYVFDEDFLQRHLWKVTAAGGIEQRLTDGPFSVLSFRVSRDGTRIVQHRAPTPLVADNDRGEVWVSDALGGDPRAVTSNGIEETEAELSPDNTQLLFLADANARLEPYHSAALFIVPATGGSPTTLLPDFPYAVDHATWAPDGRSILAVVNMGVHSELFRIDMTTRRATALTDGRHSVQFWSLVASAGRMVFQLDEPTRLGDAWTLPIDGGTPKRVTKVYDDFARDTALPRQEKVTWRGADGTLIEGLLFYPMGYQRGTRYPMVVQLHGGPLESDKFGFGPGVLLNYVPVLTTRGYAVFRPNYRGSAGYGDAFLRDVVGNYFNNMHLDVLAGVDFLVRLGVADPDRLAVMGWSAGGHLTNKLITFTTRFKAASSAAGVANWTSLFAETDTRSARTAWFGGLPWGPDAQADAFWRSSPIKDASRVRTPSLLFAGEGDARVPLPQAIEMFRALQANGVPSRLYVAPREGHQWSELRHQVFKANAELEWFERYVRQRPYAWDRVPGDPEESPLLTFRQ